jgi:hypothetical protein
MTATPGLSVWLDHADTPRRPDPHGLDLVEAQDRLGAVAAGVGGSDF